MATMFLFVDLKQVALPSCVTRPGASFVNYVYSIKSTKFGWLGMSVIVIFTRAARNPAHNDFCGTFPINVGHP
jgi:hypothetical protein